MTLNQRIESLAILGAFLGQFSEQQAQKKTGITGNDTFFEVFKTTCESAQYKNGWFTPKEVARAMENWSKALTEKELKKWVSNYDIPEQQKQERKDVAIITAGNIPLVGLHDIVSVLITGNNAHIKTSSKSANLEKSVCQYLCEISPEWRNRIVFHENRIENFDKIIATGSNNTARYFEHYFKNKESLIRKNRNSVAVLTGAETSEELEALGKDIFTYFGLGCRSVSKIYIPKNYKLDTFFEHIVAYSDIINTSKYANNYDYNKAVYLMSLIKVYDNNFITLKPEDKELSSPVGCLFYEYYEDREVLKTKLETLSEQLQCVVNFPENPKHVPFGHTQDPKLMDYADGADTIKFLLQ